MRDLQGRSALVTGANSGIGFEISRMLACRGARVTLACRSRERCEDARSRLADVCPDDDTEVRLIDLASLGDVERFARGYADSHDSLDVLVNNAGGLFGERLETADGFEMSFQVNHLSHYLLTELLWPLLRASAQSRVIDVSSDAHRAVRALDFEDLMWKRRRYRPFAAYAAAKMANILHVVDLAKRSGDDGVVAHAVHPGGVATGFGTGWGGAFGAFWNSIAQPFLKTPEEGADGVVWLASEDEALATSGGYWHERKPRRPSAGARDGEAAARLRVESDLLLEHAGFDAGSLRG